jgi:hypothetical protein
VVLSETGGSGSQLRTTPLTRRRVPLDLVIFWKVQTDCRTRPGYYSVGTGNSFPSGDFMKQANENFPFILFHIPQTTNMVTKLILYRLFSTHSQTVRLPLVSSSANSNVSFFYCILLLHFAFFNASSALHHVMLRVKTGTANLGFCKGHRRRQFPPPTPQLHTKHPVNSMIIQECRFQYVWSS